MVLRVATIVLQAVDGVEKDTVQLQPSVDGHPCVTDFYFLVKESEVPLAFIEVKNPSIAVNLGGETDAVAQTIREAHILGSKNPQATIPFIITNSLTWSFGQAKRTGSGKMASVERFSFEVDCTDVKASQLQKVVSAVSIVIQGRWPLGTT